MPGRPAVDDQRAVVSIGPTKRGKGKKLTAIVDRRSLPLAVHVASASLGEVTLIDATLDARFIEQCRQRLIRDRGHDSDPLDVQLPAKDFGSR